MMMDTTTAGSVEAENRQLVRFGDGLPGFEATKEFLLLDVDEGLPYKWLQAASDAELSLLLTNPFVFYPGYEWQLPQQVQDELGIEDAGQVEVWSVVTMAAKLEDATVNLLAPIVLNRTTGAAKQIILHDSGYRTKHPLISPVVLAAEPTEGEG